MENLKEIKEALPKGGISKIAKRMGVSIALVSLVFLGERENDKVIDTALDIIAEEKKRKIERDNRVKEVLS